MRTWIKICGTTCVEDALQSIAAGADALGFIFAPSKRRVTPEQAGQIIAELPGNVERIGVFMNSTAMEIASVVSQVALTGIQMHGEEFAPEIYAYLPKDRRDSMRKIKTIAVQDGSVLGKSALLVAAPAMVDAWLLDPGAGSGKAFNWLATREQLAGQDRKFIVAGGLTPENVGEAIRTFKPWGVDVVSGVEREPGRKDPEKLRAFVAAVREAEAA
jgi:phosphoribosylanthranilate isomerase